METANENQSDIAAEPVGRWCLVANVVEVREWGEQHEPRPATRHFAPGTKVYCDLPPWDFMTGSLYVVGRHRGSTQFARLILPYRFLTHFRVQLEYSPHVRRLMDEKYRFALGGYTDDAHQKVMSWARFFSQNDLDAAIARLIKRHTVAAEDPDTTERPPDE